jgi:hypothetical protein
VKAVKNEQSSQVSKLNDEIRLLKEKLMNQSAGAGAQDGQDASALDEKNRQRLRDLEEAMRSTWEAKSKLSEEYDRDRQALLLAQQNAARQFEAARQRNWALLEQKEDLEITLGHVRTLLADRLAHTPVAGLVGQWAEGLREVAQLERRLAEQDTVVQMYRSSLEKDSQALVQVTACTVRFAGMCCALQVMRVFLQQHNHVQKNPGGQVTFDSTAASMLRQLREKVSATCKEMQLWTDLQDQLTERVQRLLELMKGAGRPRAILQATSQHLADTAVEPATGATLTRDEKRELHRGLSLIRKQMVQKHLQIYQSVATSRRNFVSFDSVRLDFVKLLSAYDGAAAPNNLLTAGDDLGGDPAAVEIVSGVAAQAREMRVKLESGASRLVEVFSRLDRSVREALAKSSEVTNKHSNSGFAQPPLSGPAEIGEEVPAANVTVKDHQPELIYNPRAPAGQGRALSNDSAAAIAVDSPQSWACPLPAFGEQGSLVLALPRPQLVTTLQLQGGAVPAEHNGNLTAVSSVTTLPPVAALTGADLIANITLPCGLTLATVEPRHELTSAALADVFDWTALIKSNPAEKFLKRPPVRFLFDLVKFVGAGNPGLLSEPLETADWSVVGTDKTTKLDFMDQVGVLRGTALSMS